MDWMDFATGACSGALVTLVGLWVAYRNYALLKTATFETEYENGERQTVTYTGRELAKRGVLSWTETHTK